MSSQNGVVAGILADTTAHGFRFQSEQVKKRDTGDKKHPAEIVIVEDLAKFEATFPGVALTAVNGTSVRVKIQGVQRDGPGYGKTPERQRELAIMSLLGMETGSTVKVPVYLGPNDEEYATKTEAQAAWMAFAVDSELETQEQV